MWSGIYCPLVVIFALALAGCSMGHGASEYQTLAGTPNRDSLTAQELNEDGLRLIEQGDLEGAERKFRKSLEHDLYYAPAHNNLGLVLLQTERCYEAAWEFNYAAKLVPRGSEPRENLGLLYENLGRLDRAVAEYEAALEIDPDSLVTMRHLARTLVKAGRKDDRLKSLLEKLLLIPSDGRWDVWVRGQLVRLDRAESEAEPFQLSTP